MNSKIRIYSGVPLDKGYQNVHNLTVNNFLTALETYKIYEGSDFSYVSDNYTLRVPATITTVINANYIAYQNPRYKNKWFFGFVNKVDYVSDLTTQINFTIDYWSTYFNDLTILQSYVEREIVADDTIGANTLDEGLDVGRVESILSTENDFGATSACYVCIMSDYNPVNNPSWWDRLLGNDKDFSGITVHNNLVSGHQIFVIKIRAGYEYDDYLSLLLFILKCNKDGKISAVHDIFVIPSGGIDSSLLVDNSFTMPVGNITPDPTCENYLLKFSSSALTSSWNVAKVESFTDLTTIKNNKCYCYPYNYLLVTNNVGNQNIYKYEDFSDATNATFSGEFALCIGGSGRVVPLNHKGIAVNYDEAIPLAKYPTCGWTADSYTNWLTQNAVNVTTQIMDIANEFVFGATIPDFDKLGRKIDVDEEQDIVGARIGSKLQSLVGQFREAKLLPNIQGGGQNNGDVNYANGANVIKFNRMRCKPEYMRIIDDYFTRFGYKIARVKTPDLSSRPYWNYIKTMGDQFAIGNVPQDALSVINNIANKGVTIWHSLSNIGNYSLDNRVVPPTPTPTPSTP